MSSINDNSLSKVSIKCQVVNDINVVIPKGGSTSEVVLINPWFYKAPSTGNLALDCVFPVSTETTELFRKFCMMYESCKCDRVSFKITESMYYQHTYSSP